MKKLLLLFPILFFVTGCWNYRELNEIAITTALAIDLTDEGDYKVSVLIANGKNNSTNTREGQSQTVVYSGEGKTISRAFKEINLQVPKVPYIGHLGVVVISEDVAKDGMKHVIDYLLRNPESVKRFYLIISKEDKAEEVIKILSPLETFPGQSISNNIALSNEHEAISTTVNYSQFTEYLLKKGKEPILPTITIIGKAKKGSNDKVLESSDIKTKTKLSTVAIFKDDKLVGYADKQESRGINVINNQIDQMIIQYECDDGYIVTNLTNMNSSIKVELVNNKPVATIKVKADGSLQEITCDRNIKNPKVIDQIAKETKKKLQNKMQKAIDISFKYKSDIFGIGNLFYKKNPKYFESINDWNEIYTTVSFKYKFDIKISTKGSVQKTI